MSVYLIAFTSLLFFACGTNPEMSQERVIYDGIVPDNSELSPESAPRNVPPRHETDQPEEGNESPDPVDPPNPLGLIGAVSNVSESGVVVGWAADDQDLDRILTVEIYDGLIGEGQLVATLEANQPGFDGGRSGNHSFSFALSEDLGDGQTRQLFAYAKTKQGEQQLLTPDGVNFAVFVPTEEGRTFFADSLADSLNGSCGGCHVINYETLYASLKIRSPLDGGTALNNLLITMPLNENPDQNHPGGRLCNNANQGVCQQIQQWWRAEFERN